MTLKTSNPVAQHSAHHAAQQASPASPSPAMGRVLCHVDAMVAHVTLRHDGRLNAMSRAMWRELRTVVRSLHERPELRCVVLRGHDGNFCSGGDISEYPGFRFDPAELRIFHEDEVWGGLQALLDCDLPVIACIEGACMGAGIEIASCCDIRIATTDARFGAPIGRLGFPMAPRELQVVAREAGLSTARQMLLEGAVLEAAQMHERGFVHHLCDSAEIYAHLHDSIQRVSVLAPGAARMNKQMLRALATGQPDLDALCREAYAYAPDPEHRDGIESFLAKRKASFSLLPSNPHKNP